MAGNSQRRGATRREGSKKGVADRAPEGEPPATRLRHLWENRLPGITSAPQWGQVMGPPPWGRVGVPPTARQSPL